MGNVLDLVYTNYLTTYQPRTLSRYETHKRSELRSVVNDIIKTGKETPWYLQPSKETQHYAIKLKEDARELGSAIFEIGGDSDELLEKKVAFSTNPDSVEVKYIGDFKAEGAGENHSIEVLSLADRQENLGKFLPNSAVSLQPDMYSFNVNINDMNYEFQFSVDENETNRDIQERLARLVNSSKTGITADVIEQDGRSALKLISEQVGRPKGENIFGISDEFTGKRKGAVDYLGIDYVSREPKDAEMIIDGEHYSNRFNEFTINKEYEVKLVGRTPEDMPARIGLRGDLDSVAINVEKLVGGVNSFRDKLTGDNDGTVMAGKVGRELDAITDFYREPMEAIGIKFNEEGRLSMDKQTFIDFAEGSENLREDMKFLQDYTSSLLRKSNQISLNPMDYVHKTIVAYKNPGKSFPNAYNSSTYAGMMFNGYC